eukprot:CAMPEP_0182429192 /NCGR_PEP_ID=MMETSP1167-20130531/25585_1 /TAXON_ID=2988 /ORGANISM="Mallomonas Sp, Strain CCMP3275" /LENGTH=218 /DNA_ID=CAMNT_0024612573 /DNA_START=210 /DNA_END=866 /DNA_ORIENTATION=-
MTGAFVSSPTRKQPKDRDDGTKPVLFGDPFGSRAEYVSGVFYGGRCKFLHEDDHHEDNALQAPPDFMTRRQMRNALKLRSQGVQHMQKLDFIRRNEADELIATKAAHARKQDVQGKKNRNAGSNIVIQKHSSTNQDDWEEGFQAGCKFWVNRDSGEVTTECPWEAPESLDFSRTNLKIENEAKEENGAGSLVYDGTELENFLAMLDEMDTKTKKSTHK